MPAFCQDRIEIDAPAGLESLLSFDEGSQILSLGTITDSLDLAGNPEIVYTIPTVLYWKDYAGNPVNSESVDQTLTIKNPCLDPAYV